MNAEGNPVPGLGPKKRQPSDQIRSSRLSMSCFFHAYQLRAETDGQPGNCGANFCTSGVSAPSQSG
jgi:hypothetical protein